MPENITAIPVGNTSYSYTSSNSNSNGTSLDSNYPSNLTMESKYSQSYPKKDLESGTGRYTTKFGCPINPYSVNRLKDSSILTLANPYLIEAFQQFDRERIPERVVHANGSGAFGTFKVTNPDFAKSYCKASFLQNKDLKTRIAVRFSSVAGERGSADTVRDPRGFSIKFYTHDGNWDCVFNNTPVFFMRNPLKFIHFIHSQKRDPKSNLRSPEHFWRYFTENPECAHQVMVLYSDRGTPASYRNMHAYSGHTFILVNSKNERFFTKFHYKSVDGFKTMNSEEADKLAGTNPDYLGQDLFEAIENKKYPKWKCYAQIMTMEQAKEIHKKEFNIFDITKVFPQDKFPLIEFGEFELNENPENYFEDIEQIAFSPGNLIPGIEPSPDPMLQVRMFSYGDTHLHRLGPNFHQLKTNRSICPIRNVGRDGAMNFFNESNSRNYPHYSAFEKASNLYSDSTVDGTKPEVIESLPYDFDLDPSVSDEVSDVDFVQPRKLWSLFKKTGQDVNFIKNLVSHIGIIEDTKLREESILFLSNIDIEIGSRVKKSISSN